MNKKIITLLAIISSSYMFASNGYVKINGGINKGFKKTDETKTDLKGELNYQFDEIKGMTPTIGAKYTAFGENSQIADIFARVEGKVGDTKLGGEFVYRSKNILTPKALDFKFLLKHNFLENLSLESITRFTPSFHGKYTGEDLTLNKQPINIQDYITKNSTSTGTDVIFGEVTNTQTYGLNEITKYIFENSTSLSNEVIDKDENEFKRYSYVSNKEGTGSTSVTSTNLSERDFLNKAIKDKLIESLRITEGTTKTDKDLYSDLVKNLHRLHLGGGQEFNLNYKEFDDYAGMDLHIYADVDSNTITTNKELLTYANKLVTSNDNRDELVKLANDYKDNGIKIYKKDDKLTLNKDGATEEQSSFLFDNKYNINAGFKANAFYIPFEDFKLEATVAYDYNKLSSTYLNIDKKEDVYKVSLATLNKDNNILKPSLKGTYTLPFYQYDLYLDFSLAYDGEYKHEKSNAFLYKNDMNNLAKDGIKDTLTIADYSDKTYSKAEDIVLKNDNKWSTKSKVTPEITLSYKGMEQLVVGGGLQASVYYNTNDIEYDLRQETGLNIRPLAFVTYSLTENISLQANVGIDVNFNEINNNVKKFGYNKSGVDAKISAIYSW